MLRRLSSSDERFNAVVFKDGLNLLVADKTLESSDEDTRNSVGKSSMIELLHFALGAKCEKRTLTGSPPLAGMTFSLELDWPSRETSILVSRNTSKPNLVNVPAHLPRGPEGGTLFGVDSYVSVSLAEWQRIIERDLFRLNADSGLSGRTLLSFYMRRIGDFAFNQPTRTFPQQSVAEGTTALAYLLGLDWGLAAGYKELAARESMRRKLKEAAKDPVFGRIVGTAGELRAQITVRERQLRDLRQQIDELRLLPVFEADQDRADEIAGLIADIREEDAADRQNLAEIQRAITESGEPEVTYLASIYAELGEVLTDRVRRSFEEVRQFHASIVANRRRYLEEEATQTEARIEERRARRQSLAEEQQQILSQLKTRRALDSLTSLQERYAVGVAELSALRNRFDAADALESSRAEISSRRARLKLELQNDIRERGSVVNEATELYAEFVQRLYGENLAGYLQFEPENSALTITPRIEGDGGRGVGNMAIFCFDLTWAVVAHRHGRGPDFLVHDSHLLDGVDERQAFKALSVAGQVAESEGMQYVATLNTDDLRKFQATGGTEDQEFLDSALIEPRLTDASDEGMLFGFRFDPRPGNR